jgi:hypothetical protein
MSQRRKEWLLVAGLSLMWSAFYFDPVVVLVPGVILYLCLLLIVAISAVEWRSTGWISGLLFAILAATMPLWVFSLTWFYSRF